MEQEEQENAIRITSSIVLLLSTVISLSLFFLKALGTAILLVGSISLGVVAYLVADIRQRKAFLDTRQSFEMRLTIENQAREQVPLHKT